MDKTILVGILGAVMAAASAASADGHKRPQFDFRVVIADGHDTSVATYNEIDRGQVVRLPAYAGDWQCIRPRVQFDHDSNHPFSEDGTALGGFVCTPDGWKTRIDVAKVKCGDKGGESQSLFQIFGKEAGQFVSLSADCW